MEFRHSLLEEEEVLRLSRLVREGLGAQDRLDSADEGERRQLERVIREGLRAKNRLVTHNLRLVADISHRYRVDGITPDDLFQEGVIGLMHAVDLFDPDMGYRLSTYATWWIRQRVERAIADQARLIRFPVHVHEQLKKVAHARQELLLKTGRAGLDDVIEMTGLEPALVRTLLTLLPGLTSLDDVIGDGLTVLGDMIPDDHDGDWPEAAALAASDAAEARKLLAGLDTRTAEVLALRFGVDTERPLTLEEIGTRLGVTRERVRQIESKGIASIKSQIGQRRRMNSAVTTS